jgi:hypothetical protein
VGVLLDSLDSALALGPVAPDHLLQGRQMQAPSFTAHIPLVCFGIAFAVMVLIMQWWGQRTGDPLCRTIARRWSRVMITGTVNHPSGFRLVAGRVVDVHPRVRLLPARRGPAARGSAIGHTETRAHAVVDHLLGAKPHTIAYQRVRSRDGPRQAGP